MQDINELINETDTDNVTLNKLKELGTKLTGQENVQGETVAEVLEFINTNYSGGTGGGSSVEITQHKLEFFDVKNNKIWDMYVRKIAYDVLLCTDFYIKLGNIDIGSIAYNRIKLGSFNLGDTDKNLFSCNGTIPVIYQLGNMDVEYHNGLLNFEYDWNNNKNMYDLIIDKGDLTKWSDLADLSTTIKIKASGNFKAVEL